MPDIFSRDCDYILEEEYLTCRECYRYETCKNAYEKNKDKYVISTGIDELTSAIPKERHYVTICSKDALTQEGG